MKEGPEFGTIHLMFGVQRFEAFVAADVNVSETMTAGFGAAVPILVGSSGFSND